jgi:hypothetical protein
MPEIWKKETLKHISFIILYKYLIHVKHYYYFYLPKKKTEKHLLGTLSPNQAR